MYCALLMAQVETLANREAADGLLSRQAIRRLLGVLLRTDAELTAFCLDYFAEVHRYFSAGMDRISKTNLLLELVEPDIILGGLRQRFCDSQDKLDTIEWHLAEPEPEQDRQARALREELDRLYLARERLRMQSQDMRAIEAQIVELRKQQRQKAQLQEGEVLGDRYRLLEVVGRGGFAKVWQAYDLKSRRLVAVKILHSEQGEDTRRIERFARGARQMMAIEHPHIVRIVDCATQHQGFHYYVMDYIGGGDLYRRVIQRTVERADALRSILQVGMALEFAHQRRVIHRDVKPQNILLDGLGAARLTDFDLVWAPDTTGGTRTGGLGTFLYAPPEQMEDASHIDPRCDIYSLAMCTLFVLHGKPLPRKAIDTRALFIDTLDCRDSLKDLLRSATASDPDDRPAMAAEFCERLQREIDGAIPAPSATRTSQSPPPSPIAVRPNFDGPTRLMPIPFVLPEAPPGRDAGTLSSQISPGLSLSRLPGQIQSTYQRNVGVSTTAATVAVIAAGLLIWKVKTASHPEHAMAVPSDASAVNQRHGATVPRMGNSALGATSGSLPTPHQPASRNEPELKDGVAAALAPGASNDHTGAPKQYTGAIEPARSADAPAIKPQESSRLTLLHDNKNTLDVSPGKVAVQLPPGKGLMVAAAPKPDIALPGERPKLPLTQANSGIFQAQLLLAEAACTNGKWKSESEEKRLENLSSAYLKAGQYEKAITLTKKMKPCAQDDWYQSILGRAYCNLKNLEALNALNIAYVNADDTIKECEKYHISFHKGTNRFVPQ